MFSSLLTQVAYQKITRQREDKLLKFKQGWDWGFKKLRLNVMSLNAVNMVVGVRRSD